MTKATHFTAHLIFGAALVMTSLGFTCAVSGPASAAEDSRPGDCTLTVDGKSYISGPCEFVPPDKKNASFSIYGERYWASVFVYDGKAEATWTGLDPKEGHAELGNVRRVGGCWEGAKVKICARDIDKTQAKAILAARPKGLILSPDPVENICASAPGYKFEPGAALVMERCDHFLGLRQRVFKRTGNKISFEGKPGLCVDARPSADAKEMRLVLDDCARVAVRWSYEKDKNQIRSGNNLCWDVILADKDGDTPSPMIARPCAQDAEKNGHFIFRADGLDHGD